MPDKIKILYDAVSKDYSVGSFDEFASKLQDESKRKAFYDGVGAEYNLGDYDTFTSKVKKNSGQNASGSGLPLSKSGLEASQAFQKPTSKAPLVYTPEKQQEYVQQEEAKRQDLSSRLGKAKEAYTAAQDDETVKAVSNLPIYKSEVYETQEKPVMQQRIAPLMNGLNTITSSFYKIPRLLYDAAAIPQNLAADLLSNPELKADYDNIAKGSFNPVGIIDRIGDFSKGEADKWESKQQKFNQGVGEQIRSGNYGDAATQVFDNVMQSAPMIASIYLTGGVANTGKLNSAGRTIANAIPFASMQNQAIKDNPNIPDWLKPINAGLSGLSEIILEERFGTKAILDGITKKALDEGKEAAVKSGKDFIVSYIKKALNKVQPITDIVANGIEEAATQMSQNIVARATGEDAERGIFDGVEDAAIVGSAQGLGATTIRKGADLILNPKSKQKIAELNKQREDLTNDLDNDNIAPEVKDQVEDKLSKVNESINKALEANQEEVAAIPENEKAGIEKLSDEVDAKREALGTEGLSGTAKTLLEEDVVKLEEKLNDKISEIKEVAKENPVEEVKSEPVVEPQSVEQPVVEEIIPPTEEPVQLSEPETVSEVQDIVEDKVAELKSNPDATDKVLKDQKKDMLTQLNEVKNIVFGKREEPDLTPENISKLQDLGYDITDKGQVTFDVKDDGVFKIHADNIIDAISEVKKGFPEKTDTENKVKMPSTGRISPQVRAENKGSIEANEINLNNAKENLQTAVNSGNKKLQTVFEKEVEREQKIYDEAKRIGLPEKSPIKETKASEDQRPVDVGASVEGETKLQSAKVKLKEAKERLKALNVNLSIASDPKEKAKAFYDYHVALVDVAKEYISEGITTVQDFAKEIGEKVTKVVQDAWDEANGGDSKSVEDFEEVSSPNEPTDEELQLLGITKKEAKRIREERGEQQYEYDVKSRAELVAQADRMLAEGYNVPRLIKRITNGGHAEDFEVEILRRYFASLTAAINKNPTPELLAERKSLLEALDHLKTRAGRAVQAFDGFIEVEDNLASFLQDEAQYYDLSSEEVVGLTEKYNKAKEALEKLQSKQDEALSKARNKKAQSKIDEVKAKRRASVREDFEQERKQYVDDFRAKLKEIRKTASAVVLPYQNELIALAPFVKKMTESYVKQGVFELSEIVKGIHEEFKNDLPLTEDDVRDIIAGEYSNPRNTKNAKLAQVRDLETQARLERKIEELEAGINNTKSPVEKKVKSEKIQELEKQIKEIKKRNPELTYPSRVQARKTWYANQISNLKNEIKEGKYDPVEPPTPVLLDAEALQLKDEYIAFKEQTRLRRAKKEHEALGSLQKNIRRVQQITSLKRLVQTSIDLSIPLRQGVSVMLNPRTASIGVKGYGKMLNQVFNEKEYQRMMFDLRSDPLFLQSKDDGIVYTETSSSDPETRDESHPTESFLYKIPYIREPFRASERAAAAWTNYARNELYKRGVKMLKAQGKTRENAKQAYEDMAARVMVDTGRGKIPGIEDKSPSKTDTWIKGALGNTFYGARLMSSTFRKLNPAYYLNPKVDQSVRRQALIDMAGYVSSQIILTTAIAAATGASVSLDWDDPDFMKLRWGKRVIDLTAGQSTYIRTFMRLVNAAYNRVSPYVSDKDAEKYSKFATSSLGTFFRNKLAPNTSYGLNALMGKNSIGEKFDPWEIIKIYPMYGDDIVQAFKDGSPLDAAIILPIGISGLGYQEYSKDVRRARVSNYIDSNDTKLKTFLKNNQLNITGDINQEVYDLNAGMKVKMTKEQSERYEKIWSEHVISEIKEFMPELEELAKVDKKHEGESGYKDRLNAKISSIKSEATKVAQESISGVSKELMTIEKGDKTYELTPDQIKERKVYYNEFIEEFGQDIRDANLEEGKSLREAEKAIKTKANSASKVRILEKYEGEEEGTYNLREKGD